MAHIFDPKNLVAQLNLMPGSVVADFGAFRILLTRTVVELF